jgi:hypothetical protein
MIKRYVAEKDSTITNGFKSGLLSRGTGSNCGEADTCEIYSIYAQASTGSQELSRALFQFPISDILTDRTAGSIPASGSVSFFLQIFNAPHSFTVPRKFTLAVDPVSRSWDEGSGVDLDDYSDAGVCNWIIASTGSSGQVSWSVQGGDYWTSSYAPGSTLPHYTSYFDRGIEDLSLDVTSLVEEWAAGTYPNYGVGLRLTASIENALSSSYTKKFFTRGSEFFFKRPVIEARWDDSRKDQRATFYASSSQNSSNVNTLYFYSYNRGRLADLPFLSQSAQLWTDVSSGVTGAYFLTASAAVGKLSTGIYTASFVVDTSSSFIYDRWFNGTSNVCFYTGSAISVKGPQGAAHYSIPRYVVSIPDLKSAYSADDTPLFRVSTVDKNWIPNSYVKMQTEPELQVVEDFYYQVRRATDGLVVIPFGTGSMNHTRCSYDVSGSYFRLDLSLLEPSYMYQFEFGMLNSIGNFELLKEKPKFRIED